MDCEGAFCRCRCCTASIRLVQGSQNTHYCLCNLWKIFISDPLKGIVIVFLSPVWWLHEWLEIEDKEVTFLNDFSWSPHILLWSGMLLILLEGYAVQIGAPKRATVII